MAESFIRLVHVDKSYRTGDVETPVLRGTNLEIHRGELVVVLGVSGCGKTTLLNMIGALDNPTSGEIWIEGKEISRLSRRELTDLRREKVGFVFQFYNLLPTLTACENVEAGLEILGLSAQAVRETARESLARVSLLQHADKFPPQLSGGQQQRVAIARALAKQPRIVLADEPTGNLDEETASQVTKLIAELHGETQTTFVIVTHNPDFSRIADRVIHIKEGHIIEEFRGAIP